MSIVNDSPQETAVSNIPPPTDEQRKLIKATVPILVQHGLAITRHFYEKLLAEQPELRNLFNDTAQKTGQQPTALATAILAYSANIDDLTPILPVVDRICQKHASLHVLPSQYDIVGTYLLQSIKDILGDAFTSDLFDAWNAGYWEVARICINREKELYHQAGWISWRPFKVEKRIKESDLVTSFYLVPKDKAHLPLPTYKPGQFISLRKFVQGLQVYQSRQYSLSNAPNENCFRISVKCDSGNPTPTDPGVHPHPGWMSNLLHDTINEGDTVEVAAPFGDFFLDLHSSSPVVLLSAGIGLTPVLAMLNTLLSDTPCSRRVSWIHATRNKASHAFNEHVRTLANKHPDILHAVVFYSQPEEAAIQGEDYHFTGRADLTKVPEDDLYVQDRSAQYYICGPIGYMSDISEVLLGLGVERKRIHMEIFGAGSMT